MIKPAFGFSAGDFIAGIKFLIDLFCAFEEGCGATEEHASQDQLAEQRDEIRDTKALVQATVSSSQRQQCKCW